MSLSMVELVRAHIFVSGIVQGVFFRAHTQDVASQKGLKGFVRNLPDGRVEITAEGEKDRIEELIKWCHKGPPLARVKSVDVEWQVYKGEFKSFRIA